ncbi:MAG: radical SAM protein [Candidatus Dojkabacteria bacterium]|nr:radical SAM protein [Candidatus Dojkabacteria bacterium]
MIKIENIRLGFATNSSSSHSIVFFKDNNVYDAIDSSGIYDLCFKYGSIRKFSDIEFLDSNIVFKNKDIILIFILSQIAKNIFNIVKNNYLTYEIVRDVTGIDLEELIRRNYQVKNNSFKYENKENFTYKVDKYTDIPFISEDNIWSSIKEIINLNFDRKTGNYSIENKDLVRDFFRNFIDYVSKNKVALINHYEDLFLENKNYKKKFSIKKYEDFTRIIDVNKTEFFNNFMTSLLVNSNSKSKNIIFKKDNNNFVFFNRKTGTKIRMSFEEDDQKYTKASTPELVDVKITNYCPFGCKFCYMSSTLQGTHASLESVKNTIDLLSDIGVFEIAIGGGEPTLHPNICEIIEYASSKNIVVNMTTYNYKIFNNKKLLKLFIDRKLVSIGFSINKVEDVDKLLNCCEQIKEAFKENPKKFFFINKYIMAHIVLGAHQTDDFYKMISKCIENDIHILFLGPKNVGFGKDYQFNDLSKQMMFIRLKYENSLDDLKTSSNIKIKMFSVDTKFVNIAQLEEFREFFNMKKIPSELITSEEGKFSMYIDCVTNKMAPSSYCNPKDMVDLTLNKDEFLKIWEKF